MICKECENEKFFSRYNRKTKERIAWICSECNTEQAVVKKQFKSKVYKSDDSGSDDLENNE